MPIVDYPMRRVFSDESFTPYLTCRFINPDTGAEQEDLALVDTGASYCTVSSEFAQDLGYNIKKGKRGTTSTASEDVDHWEHKFTIRIYAMRTTGPNTIVIDKEDAVLVLTDIPVRVLDCDAPTLLGVKGFLENYTLTANYPGKLFSIQDFHTI